jgi:ferredoxin-like protein FixX
VEWVGDTGVFIKIDEMRCTVVVTVKVCLGRCFEIEKKLARIKSLDECMECASCWYVCGEGAIDFNWPPGGTGYRSDWG